MGRRCGPNCGARSSLLPRAPFIARDFSTLPSTALSLTAGLSLSVELLLLSAIEAWWRLVDLCIRGLASASRWARQFFVLSVLSLLNGCTAAPVPMPQSLPPALHQPWPQWVPMPVSAVAVALLGIIALAGTAAVTHAGCGCCSSGGFPPPRRPRLQKQPPPPSPPPSPSAAEVAEADYPEVEEALLAVKASPLVQRVATAPTQMAWLTRGRLRRRSRGSSPASYSVR
jgi:hypothetical protein